MSITKRNDFRAPATPAEIIASVAKPAALLLAERNLAALRKRREEVHVEREAIYHLPACLAGRRTREMDDKMRAVDAEVTVARKQAAELRVAHENGVIEALKPLRTDTVAHFADAYAKLLSAWRRVDEIDAAIGKALARGIGTRVRADQFEVIARTWISSVTAS